MLLMSTAPEWVPTGNPGAGVLACDWLRELP
jgi:hypothetical protein